MELLGVGGLRRILRCIPRYTFREGKVDVGDEIISFRLHLHLAEYLGFIVPRRQNSNVGTSDSTNYYI